MPQNDVIEYNHHLITNEMIDIFEKYINENSTSSKDITIDKFYNLC
jgi:hypothetical protein